MAPYWFLPQKDVQWEGEYKEENASMTLIIGFLYNILNVTQGCLFHRITGLYCPGCGGTRALLLFFRGDWLRSLQYHPMVMYLFITFSYILSRYAIAWYQKKHNKKAHPYQPCPWWLWGALVVLCINFAVKNIALLCFHADLLPPL